ncbi:MAG TPA: hypothetical protein VMG59_04265 [Phycisphaerae bacterium]|nr:hypothetical protein [Phycisphaerae bacterium]
MIKNNKNMLREMPFFSSAVRPAFITILMLFATMVITGCSDQSSTSSNTNTSTSISTSSSQVGPGYHAGDTYTLTCDVFLSKKPAYIVQPGLTPEDKWSPYYLNPPADDAVTPPTIADYQKAPLTWPQVMGIVPAGSKIEYLFTGTSAKNHSSQIGFPFFEIETGPYANFVVDGSLVSILGRADILTPEADPRYLKPAAQ